MIKKNFSKFEAEGREFAKILRSLEQFIQTVKGQNNFRNRIHTFLTCHYWRFLPIKYIGTIKIPIENK